MKKIQRIQALSNAFGPSGMEDEVIKIAAEEVSDFYTCKTDSMKNLLMIPKNADERKPNILLDAHSDEVGLMVQSIDDNGLLRILPIGGIEASSLLSSAVTVLSKGQKLEGIIGTIPVHFKKDSNAPADISDLRIDLGTSSKKETMALGVCPGDFAICAVQCRQASVSHILMGKAFDDRIGAAALIQTLLDAALFNLPVNVYGLLSSQEEVGDRGIQAAIRMLEDLNIEAAICFEGAPADDTFTQKEAMQTAMDQGVMVRAMDRSMITNPAFMAMADKISRLKNIPMQIAVRKGGGTNGSILHTHNIPAVILGIPVRYAHSSQCFTSLHDYDAAVKLALALIEAFGDEDENWLDKISGKNLL